MDRCKKQVLGPLGVVLLPSLKIKEASGQGTTHEQEIHEFLVSRFHGYTVASGNISGYWQDSEGHPHYGEHREYKVALLNPRETEALEHFISELAERIDETCIFMECGGESYLVYRSGSGRSPSSAPPNKKDARRRP
jgi:hypothetical protein